jgi:hypothetical protein
MTKNLKNFALASTALEKLAGQLATEAKTDPRLARTKKRADRLVANLKMAMGKYETVHGRKVPAKIAERTAGAAPKKVAKKAAKKRVAKRKPTGDHESNVVQLKSAVAAHRRDAVKRSK